MEITEVKIFLKEGQDKKLKAYATLTFDGMFVVRNVKVIEGTKGLFVAMPSRKLKDPCPKCNFRNVVRSRYCNNCGSALPMTEPKPAPAAAGHEARESEHKDIAHPITAECRDYIQKKVLEAFEKERKSPSASGSASGAASGAVSGAVSGAASGAVSGSGSGAASAAPSRGPSRPAPVVDEDNDIEL